MILIFIFILIRITKWILHETILPTNEETTRNDNEMKCKIKVEDDAKDGLLSKKSETQNWNIAVVEDGENDEDENYNGETLGFLRKGKF